jgi:hypothetical protein
MTTKQMTRQFSSTMSRARRAASNAADSAYDSIRSVDIDDTTAARGLGVASICIGLTEMLMPRQVEKWLGIRNGQNTGVLRVLGLREICHGVDLLSHDDPTPGVWSRIAGDALDGVLLGAAGVKTRNPAGFATVAAMVSGVVAADVLLGMRLSR